jgi:hypothetical protein
MTIESNIASAHLGLSILGLTECCLFDKFDGLGPLFGLLFSFFTETGCTVLYCRALWVLYARRYL